MAAKKATKKTTTPKPKAKKAKAKAAVTKKVVNPRVDYVVLDTDQYEHLLQCQEAIRRLHNGDCVSLDADDIENIAELAQVDDEAPYDCRRADGENNMVVLVID